VGPPSQRCRKETKADRDVVRVPSCSRLDSLEERLAAPAVHTYYVVLQLAAAFPVLFVIPDDERSGYGRWLFSSDQHCTRTLHQAGSRLSRLPLPPPHFILFLVDVH
jgi:hypothetical protein